MKEQVKHAAKSFWSGAKSPIITTGSFIARNPRWVCSALLAIVFLSVVASIEGMMFFLVIIGSIAAAIIAMTYLLICAISNSWTPWEL